MPKKRVQGNPKPTSISAMEMAPEPFLFSIILNVSPWLGSMTFYWSGRNARPSPFMYAPPFHQKMRFRLPQPQSTWEKNRCLGEPFFSLPLSLWPLWRREKFARYCYLTVDRWRVAGLATEAVFWRWGIIQIGGIVVVLRWYLEKSYGCIESRGVVWPVRRTGIVLRKGTAYS